MLQRRALQAYTRNPLNVAGRTMMAIFIGILGGLVFMMDVSGEPSCQAAATRHRPPLDWHPVAGRTMLTVSVYVTDMVHGYCPQL